MSAFFSVIVILLSIVMQPQVNVVCLYAVFVVKLVCELRHCRGLGLVGLALYLVD